MINYKLNVCRITVASQLFAASNYYPLFRVITPADAARELNALSGGTFRPKNHYMPVLLSSANHNARDVRKSRPHRHLDGYRYMQVRLETNRHARLLALLEARPRTRLRGRYAYRVEERDTCFVLDARLEEAARAGDIADVTIADNADKMILRLRGGDKLMADATDYEWSEDAPRMYDGRAATTKEHEARHHHYGKSTMSITHVFETKERTAALRELERLQQEARRRKRTEREWKDGMCRLLAGVHKPATREPVGAILTGELASGLIVSDMKTTLDVSARLTNADLVHKLPLIKDVTRIVERHLAHAQLVELAQTTGALVSVDDERELFLVGQTLVAQDGERMFVPGQTVQVGEALHYMPGITVNLGDAAAFVAGTIFADEKGTAVFLPGQALVSADGTMRVPSSSEHITIAGTSTLLMSEEERKHGVHRCKIDKKRLNRENRRRAAAATETTTAATETATVTQETVVAVPEIATAVSKIVTAVQETVTAIPEIVTAVPEIVTAVPEIAMVTPETVTERPTDDVAAVLTDERRCSITKSESVADGNGDVDGFSVAAEPELDMERSKKLRRFEEEISKGTFLQDHKSFLVEELNADAAEVEAARAKLLQEHLDEEHKKNARVADDMRQVIEALELKKVKLVEKLRNIQNETQTVEDREISYIFPAKANALAVELGFDGREARDAGKILLGVTRWAAGCSAKFHVHGENVPAPIFELDIEDTDAFTKPLGSDLRTALRASMAAAASVLRERPRDLEAGMRAAGRELVRSITGCERPDHVLHELSAAVQSRTDSERNVIFSDTLKELTKKVVINKAETLRSVVREEYDRDKIVAKLGLVIEDEGDLLVRAFANLSVENDPFIKEVYERILAATELGSEQEASTNAHRAIVDAVQSVHGRQLDKILREGSAHDIGHLLLEARTLAQLVGMRNEAKTLERIMSSGDDDCAGIRTLAADHATLDIVRRALLMRRLAERNPHLETGMVALRESGGAGRCHHADDPNVRELVLESAALGSYSCQILSSLDIPSFLFELSDSMAMEDFLVRSIKKSGALLISCGGTQAVVPKEAARFVLAGLVPYTLIDDRGVSHFGPKHMFSALKLDKKKERMYHRYSCVGAFDKYAYSVPIREYTGRERPPVDQPCTSRVCNIGGGSNNSWQGRQTVKPPSDLKRAMSGQQAGGGPRL